MDLYKIERIIWSYNKLKSKIEDTLLSDCLRSKSLNEVIMIAATSKDKNKNKHDHQYRIPNHILNKFADNLLKNIKSISNARTFKELYSLVQNNRIKGIGALTVYDTSQRIGMYLKLYPEYIYLHRGTKQGAEILLGKIKKNIIKIEELPKPFKTNNLSAAEIEDILCIYKERLKSCV